MIELAVLEALTLDALGEIDGAMDALRRALTLVEPAGYVCVFAREGRSSRTEAAARAGALGILPTSGRGASLGSSWPEGPPFKPSGLVTLPPR